MTSPAKPFLCVLLVSLLLTTGCQQMTSFRKNFRSQTPDEETDEADLQELRVETEFIGSKISFAGTNWMDVQSVGLVVGLKNTGGDPPPSIYRSRLLDDMRKRKVKNPNAILRDPSTALVVVRAYVPPVVKKGDTFDIELRLPENSEATSLDGGWLMETRLSEQAIVPGRVPLKGHEFAIAKGPILISAGESDVESTTALVKRGRVLGGARAIRDRSLGLYLRNDFHSVRNSRRIANRISQRFFNYKYSQREGLAEAKTHQYIKLELHPIYKNNQARYLQVIRNIAIREEAVEERARMERLRKELANPLTAAKTALRLEAIGHRSVGILKEALDRPSLEVRFYAAEALAYLGDPSGVADLAEAAKTERAFRVFALAALSVIDESVTYFELRQLLNERSVETRYGSFRALWTLDKNDPFIRGENLNDQFNLHVLSTSGDPLIHLTRTRVAEVVLFGNDQHLRTPLSLTAGPDIMINAPAGSETVSVTRFAVGEDQRRKVSTRIDDVIRAVTELGATYPDVAQMLNRADRQYNLPGRLEIDALPQAGRVYYRPTGVGAQLAAGKRRKARIGRATQIPNLFPAKRRSDGKFYIEKSEQADDEEPQDDSEQTGEATLTDVSEAQQESEPAPKKGFLKNLFTRNK